MQVYTFFSFCQYQNRVAPSFFFFHPLNAQPSFLTLILKSHFFLFLHEPNINSSLLFEWTGDIMPAQNVMLRQFRVVPMAQRRCHA